jgi:hypothetical protein
MQMRRSQWSNCTLAAFLVVFVAMPFPSVVAADGDQPITLATFVRAESDVAIKLIYDKVGFGVLFHTRVPTPLDQQAVIRMNRDTLYSTAVLDLSKPAAVTLPEADGRYMSLHVISQDHYSYAVSEPGRYELTEDAVGSRYAYLIFRTFIDADDPKDIEAANALQDAIVVEGGGDGPLDIPEWNREQLLTARGALNTLAKLGMNAARAFGTREETDPIDHLVGAAAGWGGLPQKNAFYEIASVSKNDGTPHAVTVKDVPVDAFWSVTVYNADGYIDENPLGVYSFNNVTATPNDDGSVTIHFGGCDDGRVNCLPISEGWNYAARMYEPRPEILDGSWTFPEIKPVR